MKRLKKEKFILLSTLPALPLALYDILNKLHSTAGEHSQAHPSGKGCVSTSASVSMTVHVGSQAGGYGDTLDKWRLLWSLLSSVIMYGDNTPSSCGWNKYTWKKESTWHTALDTCGKGSYTGHQNTIWTASALPSAHDSHNYEKPYHLKTTGAKAPDLN